MRPSLRAAASDAARRVGTVDVDHGDTACKTPDDGNVEREFRVELGAFDATKCPSPTVVTTVTNAGSAPASGVVVRYYAGDPSAAGTPFTTRPFPASSPPARRW